MEELLNGITSSFDDTFSIYTYVLFSVICAILLFILSIVYTRFGQSISNRAQLSKVLIIVGLTTFIIISIVKSSLALSLGLVGALSIVRFRTAIKEPEELGYFFMAISIGLGMGANQLWPTLIGFLILMAIIIIQNKSNINGGITQTLLVNVPGDENQKSGILKEVAHIIEKSSKQVDVKRIQINDEAVSLNFLVNVASLNDLSTIHENLIIKFPNMDLTFLDSTI